MSWLIDTFVMTGALIALVLVLRRPVARWFGPGMAYALWALPLLRLVLPPLILPQARESATNVVEAAPVDLVMAPAGAIATPASGLLDAIPVMQWLTIIWLCGAVAFIVWRIAGHMAMRRDLLGGARPVGEAGAVRLVESPAVVSPVAFGCMDKVVALPPGFMAREDRAARDLAIAHELEHHAGRDLAVNWAMQPLLALHWFNPLAWLGWRAMRRDQEAACDARVLAGRGAATRVHYAHLIASFAQGPRLALAAPMACPMLGEKSIVHRLRSLTMTEPSPRRSRLGRLMIGAGVLALPLTATITYAASEDAASTPSPAPKVRSETRVVVIEHDDGHNDGKEPKFSRTITSDGKTIVIKSDKPLSEAEVQERLARIEADLPAPPAPPVPPAPGEVAAPPAPPAPAHVVMIRRIDQEKADAEGDAARVSLHAEEMSAHALALAEQSTCKDGARTYDFTGSSDKDRERMTTRIRICAMNNALESLRRARAGIASDPHMAADVRAQVLKGMDEEISRLSKDEPS